MYHIINLYLGRILFTKTKQKGQWKLYAKGIMYVGEISTGNQHSL